MFLFALPILRRYLLGPQYRDAHALTCLSRPENKVAREKTALDALIEAPRLDSAKVRPINASERNVAVFWIVVGVVVTLLILLFAHYSGNGTWEL
jgi:hypothetical protein